MLVIRGAQLQALQDAFDARFAQQLAALITRRFSHKVIPGGAATTLSEDVLAYVHEARSYGITAATAVADYVGLKFDLGVAFNRHPAIAAILEDASIDPDGKIETLMLSLADRDWAEVRRYCSDRQSELERSCRTT
jgi:hypothetical protein